MSNANVVLEDPTLAALRAAASEIEYLLTRSILAKPDKDRHIALLSLLQRQSDDYAAHLAAQTEWPSETDLRCAVSDLTGFGFEQGEFQEMYEDDLMRLASGIAALQSVRPPVGVVSEPEWIGSLRNGLMQSK